MKDMNEAFVTADQNTFIIRSEDICTHPSHTANKYL